MQAPQLWHWGWILPSLGFDPSRLTSAYTRHFPHVPHHRQKPLQGLSEPEDAEKTSDLDLSI
jgi:hypothetical protein